jgi:hypothetical protein
LHFQLSTSNAHKTGHTGNVDQEWLVVWQWTLFWSLVDHGAVKLIRRTSVPN